MSDVQALVQLHFAERSVREERHFPGEAWQAKPGTSRPVWADGVMNGAITNQRQVCSTCNSLGKSGQGGWLLKT